MLGELPNTKASALLQPAVSAIMALFDARNRLAAWVPESLLRLTPPQGSRSVPGRRSMICKAVLSRFTRNSPSISVIWKSTPRLARS